MILHPFRMLPLLAVLVLLTHPPGASAQIRWEKTAENFLASSSQEVYVARYPFINAGSRPVTIRDIETNCGCTAAELSKTTYAPGERDEVVVSFLLRGRRGNQEKHIRIKTDDPASDVELTLEGVIEEVATVKPLFLMWRKDAPDEWKTARIETRLQKPVHITSVEPSNPAFTAELNPIEPGRSYEIRVRPANGTAMPETAVIKITTDAPGTQTLYVHARVK